MAASIALLLAAPSAPAAVTVANQNDSGPGSLRQALLDAPAGETVVLPAGVLTLSGKGLKSQTAAITGQAAVALKVLTKGGVRKALRRRGKRKVKINLTYAPTGNAAATQSRTTKLVKKKHREKHAKKHRR